MTRIDLTELLASADLSPEFREFFQAELVAGRFDSLMEFFNSSTLSPQEIYPALRMVWPFRFKPLSSLPVSEIF